MGHIQKNIARVGTHFVENMPDCKNVQKRNKSEINQPSHAAELVDALNFPCIHANRLSLLRDTNVSLAEGFSNKSRAKKYTV